MFETSSLNPEQRQAVQHDDAPLLILAGAGTGQDGDARGPGGPPARAGSRARAGVPADVLPPGGDRDAHPGRPSDRPALASRVRGARSTPCATGSCAATATSSASDPSFSLLDAGDTVELIGLVRHDLGLGRGTGNRFPRKETLAAILSRVANAQLRLSDVLARSFPWCSEDLDGRSGRLRRLHRPQAGPEALRLRRSVAAGPGARRLRGRRPGAGRAVRPRAGRRVPGRQRPAGRPGRAACDRAVDGVTVVGDDAQAIYGFRAATTEAIAAFPTRYPRRHGRAPRAQLPLHPTHPGRRQPGHGGGPARGRPSACGRQRPGRRRPVLRTCYDEAAQAEAVCDSVLGHREAGVALRIPGRAVPGQPPRRRARAGARPAAASPT